MLLTLEKLLFTVVLILILVCTAVVRALKDAVENDDRLDTDRVVQAHRIITGLLSLPAHLNEDCNLFIKEYPVG